MVAYSPFTSGYATCDENALGRQANVAKQQRILPLVDRRLCNGCAVCEHLCPTGAVVVRAARAEIVRPEDCLFCDRCETFCPSGAISRPFLVVFELPDS
jgi:formate hydrogenlyase subunit 6/NADH:ubiquinone oxidoreductase subunit I